MWGHGSSRRATERDIVDVIHIVLIYKIFRKINPKLKYPTKLVNTHAHRNIDMWDFFFRQEKKQKVEIS